MFDRLRSIVRRELQNSVAAYPRPNELRRDVVRAERLRREATEKGGGSGQPRSTEEAGTRRAAPAASPLPQARTAPHPTSGLRSRSGLRQALRLKEILGPPRSLRGPGSD